MNNNALNMLSSRFNGQGMQQQQRRSSNIPADLIQFGLGGLSNTASSTSVAQGSNALSGNNQNLIQLLYLSAFDNHHHQCHPTVFSNNIRSCSEENNHDNIISELTLTKLLSNSSPHLKQKLMQRLQSEESSGRFSI